MHWLDEDEYLPGDEAAILLVLQAHRHAKDRPSLIDEIRVATGIEDVVPALQRLRERGLAVPISGRWASR